jgi:hypothetical protein
LTSKFADRRLGVFYAFLLLANVAGPLGLMLGIRSGRSEFFGLTAVLFIGILVADVLVLVSRGEQPVSVDPLYYHDSAARATRALNDVRVPASVLLLGVFVLTVVGRGQWWYLSIGAFFMLMLARIYFADYDTQPVGADVVLLMLGAGLLIASQTLTVAYYAVTRDTMYHSAVATRLGNYGLGAVAGTRYDDLQIYHVIKATGIGMTDTSARLFAAVFFAVVFPVTVPIALEVVRNLGLPSVFGVLAGVTMVVNPEFISWGSQAHPQSLSFLFLVFFILLLSERTHHLRSLVLSLLLIGAWVMTHHLSVFMSIALLGVPVGVVGVQRAVQFFRQESQTPQDGFPDPASLGTPMQKYVILVGTMLLYWEETGIIREPTQWLFEYSPAASAGVDTTQSLIITYDDPVTLIAESIPTVLSDLHYGLWLGAAALGIWALFKSTRVGANRIPPVLLSFFAAALLYFPNPTWVPLQGIALLPRWGIMTLPFIAIAVVLGLERLGTNIASEKARVVPVLMIVLLVTVSVSSGFSDPSPTDIAGYEKGERKYLSNADLGAFTYTVTYSNRDDEVTSGGIMNNFFILQDWERRPGETRRAGGFVDRYNRIQVVDGELVVEPGLTVFQQEAFREKGIKAAWRNPDFEAYEGLEDVTVFEPVSNEDVDWRGDQQSIVYSNEETVIAYLEEE